MQASGFLLLLVATLSRGLHIPTTEPTAEIYDLDARYSRRCDDDDCEYAVSRTTKSQSSASSSSSSNSTIYNPIAQTNNSQTHATVVALACIVGVLIVSIVVFFLWRRAVRPQQRGPRPYIEISEGDARDARPVSGPPQVGDDTQNRMETDPVDVLPPVRPFLGVEPRAIHYRSFGDFQGHWDQEKVVPRIAINGATGDEQSEAGFDAPPPGYRSTETIALA
ncbi:hypothetical protein B0H12DRAFT_1328954 [Mycena haematopus]|nr:hypothetical protein B0H12DRAFT_1328954 [Mycena haematopus]